MSPSAAVMPVSVASTSVRRGVASSASHLPHGPEKVTTSPTARPCIQLDARPRADACAPRRSSALLSLVGRQDRVGALGRLAVGHRQPGVDDDVLPADEVERRRRLDARARRVVADRSATCTTRASLATAMATPRPRPGRVDLVRVVVQLVEIAVQARHHLGVAAELELDLLRQDQERPVVGQLRIVGGGARHLLGEIGERAVVEAAQLGHARATATASAAAPPPRRRRRARRARVGARPRR